MIKAIWGLTHEPFKRDNLTLLPQQKHIFEIIKIHAQQGGFSVIVGEPGVGKTVLREHIENLNKQREFTVASCSRTLHTYRQIAWQLADAFKLETTDKHIEKDLIQAAFTHVQERKTLYILIDEAHLLELSVLRKLRKWRKEIAMMKTLLLKTYYSPEEAYNILMLLDELRDIIWHNYREEIEQYEQQQSKEPERSFDIEDDEIPF